jgi:6-pyruvoyltetrahydropterin/6-carboxytetrahydropterin synthase
METSEETGMTERGAMFELSVDTHFAAAHFLRGYEGDCGRLHGHTWGVTLTVAAEENQALGMALNYLEWFDEENPTAENIAKLIFELLEREFSGGITVRSVTVAESGRYRVTYRKDAESG